jgi:DNA-binding MarR family transcriptional regulator
MGRPQTGERAASRPVGSPLTKSEFEALASFRFGIRQYLRFSEETARAHGVTPQQYQVLLALKGFPDREWATVGELAERLQLRHHSTVELIDRLVAKGFAERQRAESDRRQVHVRLTKSGQQILRKLSMRHSEQLRSDGPELLRVLQEITKGESGKGERQAATQSPVGAR